jgi:hypothetical protein
VIVMFLCRNRPSASRPAKVLGTYQSPTPSRVVGPAVGPTMYTVPNPNSWHGSPNCERYEATISCEASGPKCTASSSWRLEQVFSDLPRKQFARCTSINRWRREPLHRSDRNRPHRPSMLSSSSSQNRLREELLRSLIQTRLVRARLVPKALMNEVRSGPPAKRFVGTKWLKERY